MRHGGGLFAGKKGQARSMVDVILSIVLILLFAGVVAFFLVSFETSKKEGTERVLSFRQESEGLSSVRLRLFSGEDLRGEDISQIVNESRVIGGKVITGCLDYLTEGDCVRDSGAVARFDLNERCVWLENDERCDTLHVVS